MTLHNQKGMTLVEIIAVIVLIGLIMGVVVRGVIGQSDSAKAKLNGVKMEKVKNYLAQYRLQYNTYPSSLDGLIKASGEAQKAGPFTPLASEDELEDVWGTKFNYRVESGGRSFSLTTYGADGAAGGEGVNADFTVTP